MVKCFFINIKFRIDFFTLCVWRMTWKKKIVTPLRRCSGISQKALQKKLREPTNLQSLYCQTIYLTRCQIGMILNFILNGKANHICIVNGNHFLSYKMYVLSFYAYTFMCILSECVVWHCLLCDGSFPFLILLFSICGQLSGFKKVVNYTKKVTDEIRHRRTVSREEVKLSMNSSIS